MDWRLWVFGLCGMWLVTSMVLGIVWTSDAQRAEGLPRERVTVVSVEELGRTGCGRSRLRRDVTFAVEGAKDPYGDPLLVTDRDGCHDVQLGDVYDAVRIEHAEDTEVILHPPDSVRDAVRSSVVAGGIVAFLGVLALLARRLWVASVGAAHWGGVEEGTR